MESKLPPSLAKRKFDSAISPKIKLVGSSDVKGGPNSGHGAEEKPATAAVTGSECPPLKSYTRQAFRTIRPLKPSVLQACILWRRSGLNLDRPLHSVLVSAF